MRKRKGKKQPKNRVTAKRSFTAKNIQDIEVLAELIGNVIPATSFSNGFCFQKIAKENGLEKFWKAGKNKKEQIAHLFSNALKYHPKIFYKMLRHNLAKGIQRRFKQGNPVLKAEMDGIDKVLKSLSINLSKEIAELNLPSNL